MRRLLYMLGSAFMFRSLFRRFGRRPVYGGGPYRRTF